MSRSTQFIGHTSEVSRFIAKCEQLPGRLGEVLGMFEEGVHDLRAYVDGDGHLWEEFVQDEPWSSGPMIFLGIRRPPGLMTPSVPGAVMGWTQADGPLPHGAEFDPESGLYWV